jgi:ATP-dependent exoDNAse (exonuclease V) alpha subunit
MYHFSVKTVSRAAGRSATAAAAYRSASEIVDMRTGDIHDYRRKSGVEHTEIVLPDNAPDWANDRAQLWNAAEQAETRKNSTVAREFEVAIPKELSQQHGAELVRDFTRQLVEKHQFAAEFAIHQDHHKDWKGEEKTFDGHHAHILCTTRRMTPNGLSDKTRELDGHKTGRENVEYWREQWATTANRHLERAGYSHRIDHRSLKDQGIDRDPTQHLGPSATAQERRGQATDLGDINRRIESAYSQGIHERRELEKLGSEMIMMDTNIKQALQEREQTKILTDRLNAGADAFEKMYESIRREKERQEEEKHKDINESLKYGR